MDRTNFSAHDGKITNVSGIGLKLAFLAGLIAAFAHVPAPAISQEQQVGEVSGLPLPRFVSVKSSPTNVRVGPSQTHEIAWVFERSSIPLEIIQEFDNWRRIRDPEGESGWMHHSLLTGRRTAIVTPWERDLAKTTELFGSAALTGTPTALLQPGVVANIQECNGDACRLEGADWRGWIDQRRLWGVYPNEMVR